MPQYNRVSVIGTLPGGESWSINVNFHNATSQGGIQDFTELQDWADAIATLSGDSPFPAVIEDVLSSAVTISKVRVEYQTDSGLGQAAEHVYSTQPTGTGLATKPYQVALVCSFLSSTPGRSRTGRIYLPAYGTTISSSTLRISSSNAAAIATAMATWLGDVAEAAGATPAMNPAVVSLTKDEISPITTVRVGDVLDTQRRRRDALAESYSSAAV